MTSAPETYGDVDGLIMLLLVACEDPGINTTLEHLLSQPDTLRRAILVELLAKLRAQSALPTLIEAMACLVDDQVAERVYAEIYQCGRSMSRL
jgi:hypothetical protein